MSAPYIHPQAIVESNTIGDGTRVWAFAHVMADVPVGKDCNIGEGCFIEQKSSLGDRVTVKNGVSVWEGVSLADDVFVGPNAVFTNVRFPVSRERSNFEKTVVRQGVCIGANATVVCGVTIGEYAFVGAGAVVTKDIPPHAFVYGNPARAKGFLCACRKKLRFIKNKAVCVCGKRFVKNAGRVAAL